MQAEHHFRKAKARTLDRDAGLAGEGDFEAAAQAEAVDHRDGWNFQGLETVDHRVGTADRRLDRMGIGGTAKFVDVRTGNKSGIFCGANHNSGGPLAFQSRQHGLEFFHHFGGERISAGTRAIEQQPGNSIGVAGQLEIAIRPVCLRLWPEFQHAIVENVHDP